MESTYLRNEISSIYWYLKNKPKKKTTHRKETKQNAVFKIRKRVWRMKNYPLLRNLQKKCSSTLYRFTPQNEIAVQRVLTPVAETGIVDAAFLNIPHANSGARRSRPSPSSAKLRHRSVRVCIAAQPADLIGGEVNHVVWGFCLILRTNCWAVLSQIRIYFTPRLTSLNHIYISVL